MPRLLVTNFSSIKEASIDIGPLTLLVGPQASGKSVLSKLAYFFIDIPGRLPTYAAEGNKLREVRNQIEAAFREWFPPSAWGSGQFSITYESGDIRYGMHRRSSGGKSASTEVEVALSPYVTEIYRTLFERYQNLRLASKQTEDEEFLSTLDDPRSRIQAEFYRAVNEHMNSSFVKSQIFVPAGRSFFTTLGKAFAILEYGDRTETIMSRFGSLYAALLDGHLDLSFTWSRSERDTRRAEEDIRRTAMIRLFDGHLRMSGNNKFLETLDGRRISFALMSSGQQELLPLWLALRYMQDLGRLGSTPGFRLMFIEEPEAHLFPSTQSFLVQYLASIVNKSNEGLRLFLTTHSPYILAKLNTLLKAGELAAGKENKTKAIASILPRETWLAPGSVRAYAIRNGITEGIVDEDDGLLSGSYLDEISNEISAEFTQLLEIEIDS